ncbi:response regulator transcription factor [Turicibacter sanguinis]|uniref:response regulator transcription factor n=1 Tax=Turicibacter sanguinis TaxID=154288 RepID=UPI00325C234D
MIRILIVDDEALIRDGLRLMLSLFEDIEVVATASNGEEALKACQSHPDIDLVLIDIRMPLCHGVLGTRLIKEAFPKIKVLILTTFKDQSYIQEAMQLGASGYLLKDSSHEVIYEGIKSAIMGNVIFHPEVATQLLNTQTTSIKSDAQFYEQYRLSEKELMIIREIATGLTNKEIAAKLFLSEGTIKNHITNILFKLELRDRTQIAIFAFKNGLA